MPLNQFSEQENYAMKQNILIIEENAPMRYLLSSVLNADFKTSVHSDCYGATKELRNNKVQVIVMNVEDVNTRNFDFLLHLTSSGFYSSIPVIVITNNTSNDFRLKCLDLGVEAFFLKPFDPLSLLDCIKVNAYLSENMLHMAGSEDFELKYKVGSST
jgi:DNA-binding response OmpR family regulator